MRAKGQSLLPVALAALAIAGAASNAAADVQFSTGNQQYDNVNINADVLVHNDPLTAYVNNDPDHTPFYFANPHAANGDPIPYLHGSHGDAAVEAWKCDPKTDSTCTNAAYAHVPFFYLEMYIEPGWGISAMDWKLDQWDSRNLGKVTFAAYDVLGNLMPLCDDASKTSQTFDMTAGQVEFKLSTCKDELVSKLVMTADASGISDVKQVSVLVEPFTAPVVPEPTMLALLGAGLLALAASRRGATA